MFSEKNTE